MVNKVTTNLLVFGGRDLCYDKVKKTYRMEGVLKCFKVLNVSISVIKKLSTIKVVDGVATGADTIGFRWGQSNGFEPLRFKAKWHDEDGVFDRLAGFERNSKMLTVATHCVGFWDGISNGTNDTRKKCIKLGLPLRMFKYSYEGDLLILERVKEWEK